MLQGQDNMLGLEDPLASCVAPQQKAVISQQLIGGSEPCCCSLIGGCQCVWWLANEGEKLKSKVTVALPTFFFPGLEDKESVTEPAHRLPRSFPCIKSHQKG